MGRLLDGLRQVPGEVPVPEQVNAKQVLSVWPEWSATGFVARKLCPRPSDFALDQNDPSDSPDRIPAPVFQASHRAL
ncbi:MAG: hypothetical protein CMH12_15385 [Maritimibacter sp.]|nr:hypothetical protein [Maritimibacter sp.]